MKRKFLLLMLALIAMATTARAQVVLNETNFPDANFRAALASILGISEGDEITEAKIAATTTIDVSSKSIADLKGIEHFTALETLSCGNNQLTSLNVSNNTALTGLSCGGNQLTSLDVSKNTALTWLSCGYSQLTSLDVSKNTALTSLGCIGNQLTSLDVSKNAALTSLTCYFNQLTSLDVSRCTALKDLECSYNQLTSLDVSKNTALTGLGCSGNRLTSLDVSQNTALTWLNCNDNQLTSLDVSSKNTALERLNCRANKIKSKEMDALVESLPMVESGKFYVINTKYKNEGNVCTKSQVGIAKGKGWTVYDYNGGNSQEYEGSDPVESSCPDDNHPHMIDLGLPSGTKWACCNLGAAKPEDYGGYYAWGETEEKDYYDWSTYDHCDGTERTSHDIGNDIAGTQYDAATANWGSPWMMPNIDQIKELLDNCESERTTENGVKGYRYTGPNGVSVFFPAGSLRHAEVDRNYLGTDGVYWSSSLTQWDTDKAYELIFTGNDTYYIYNERSSGLSVRPVAAKNEKPKPYAVWCKDNNTLYFLSSSSELKVGGTYKGYTISSLWSGEAVTNSPENKGTGYSPIAWMGIKKEKVVIEESFKDVLVNSTSAWFMGVESIEGLENLNTSNVTSMSFMFGSSKLTNLDLSHFDTRNVKYMQNMFLRCPNLASVNLSHFDTQNVLNMHWMFGECTSLSNLDLSSFNTENVTDMGSMFSLCSNLTSLDVGGFNTENVTDMGGMFGWCSNLTNLDVSKFKTENVTDMSSMFSGCSSLTSLDVSGFNTENVTNMHWMFSGCSSLTSLDVSGFNTENVTDMGSMFSRCSNLTDLDVSKFKTENVADMSSMFSGCSSLTSLDISGFNTENVTDMSLMFEGCTNLETLYASNSWSMSNVDVSYGMFNSCEKLVGGSGTVYNSKRTDGQYARIDGGYSNPGYFTDKNAEQTFNDGDLFTFESVEGVALTYRVISAANRTCQVGGGDYNVRACDVNTTGTVTVPEVAKGFRVTTVGGYAFYKCSGLTQINLPETIKSIVYCAFQGCSGLTSFVIPSSVTSLSGNHQWNGCTGLTSIHIPANVTSMGNHTFANCPNILEVTVDENNPVFESPAGSHAIINKSKKSIVQGFKNTVIPEGITYIESAAFVGNEYNDIVLPKSFNGFYLDAFEYNAVRSITVAEGNTHFDSRNNCNALMETATDKLVKGCANTVIPSETKIIGEWAFAYAYDSNDYPSLKTVVLPEGLTKIENWAFGYCKDLEEVTIPSTVTEIMYNAFVGSDNMKKLVSYIQEPFALGEYAFDVWQNKIITLYVPRGTKPLYESTEGWKEFQNIVEMDMNPVEDGDNIDFGTDMNEGDDLNGNVIGDIYYNINTGNGGYDAAEGCIVVKKPTDDGTVNDLEGKDIFGEDFKSQFTGIVFKVPAGKGTIKVNAETTGNMLLKVKIGNNDPVEMELNGKLKVTFPYNVSETTYVYIYAGAANEAKGFGAPTSGDAALKIYGIEFIRDNTPTDINSVDSGELTVDSWYTIDGKKLAGEPKEKGIYIRNGKKVVK